MGDSAEEYDEYAGCVYSNPPARYGRQGAEDLSAHALSNMDCVGLPVCDSHDASMPIGKVTDQWQSDNGSKYVSFRVPRTAKTFPQREGIKSGFYGHLSLSHKIGSPHPEPLEVSVCHKGRREGTLINMGESVADYKRRTMGSSNSTRKLDMSAPQTSEPMATDEPVQNTETPVPAAAPSPAESSAPAATKGGVMPLMENMISSLPEEQRKVFVDHQLEIMRELENANKKLEESTSTNAQLQKDLEASKADGEKLQTMTNQNIADTMRSIKNFFVQGADQGAMGAPQMEEIEKMFQSHPTHHHLLSPVISCMATRTKVLESTMNATQQLSKKSKEETELFERLRGITRDSSNPTYDFHGFDGQSQSASSVSANSGKRKAEAEPEVRKRTQLHSPNMQSQLSMLAGLMNKNLPSRPNNIRSNE